MPAGFKKIAMHFFGAKWRTLIIGVVTSVVFTAAGVPEAIGESESLDDGNQMTNALRHKFRRKKKSRPVDLAWAPSPSSPNIDGYRVYYGTASGRYSEHLDVGIVTNAKLPGPVKGNTYFYVVVAYKGPLESPPSNEVKSSATVLAPTKTADETTTSIFPRPSPSPGIPTASSTPAPAPASVSLPESTQPLPTTEATTAATPTLRFQRRLQRLGIQPRESNQAGGAAHAETAPQ
jgi:hypothetical protein